MYKLALLALALCCVAAPACKQSPAAPGVTGNLEIFVSWEGQGLPDRKLEILELGLAKKTDARGIATFDLPPGHYTLRAFVNAGGPVGIRDRAVVVPPGERVRVAVVDCLPCV